MSLRAFHLFFIGVAVILAFGIAWFEYSVYREGRATVDLAVCIVQVGVGLALIAYGFSFRRKTRSL